MQSRVTTVGPLAAASATAIAASQSLAGAGNLNLNGSAASSGVATLDEARQVVITSAGNDSGINFTIFGTNWAGDQISETVKGANTGAADSVLDYLTVINISASGATASTVEVGTTSAAHSPWINLDSWAFGATSVQCAVAGTVSYNVEVSNDDPNYLGHPIAPAAMAWDNKYVPGSGAGVSIELFASVPAAPVWIRIALVSGSGSVRMTVVQQGNAPY